MYLSEWQPEQYAMKLRAPRCRDGRFATSLSAWRSQVAFCSLADAVAATSNSASAPMTGRLLVRIVGHSSRNRAIAVGLGHERQQDEEREVQRYADSRQQHIR